MNNSHVIWQVSSNLNLVSYSLIECTFSRNLNPVSLWIQISIQLIKKPLFKTATECQVQTKAINSSNRVAQNATKQQRYCTIVHCKQYLWHRHRWFLASVNAMARIQILARFFYRKPTQITLTLWMQSRYCKELSKMFTV